MKAFTVVMTVDSPDAEGYVALVRKKGENGAKKATTLFIGPKSDGYFIFSVLSDMEKEVRGNSHCKEVQVTDSLWDAAKAYVKARKGDSKSALTKADADLRKALGSKLWSFIFVGGAMIGHAKKSGPDRKKQKRDA